MTDNIKLSFIYKERLAMHNRFIPQFSNEEINNVYQKLDPKSNRACNNNIL